MANIAAILLMSCTQVKYVPSSKSDSTMILTEVIYRDSLIYVPVPSESESVVTPEDSSHLETSMAESSAMIKDGKLYHSLRNKDVSLPYRFAIPETRITTEKKSLDVKIMEVEKDFTRWQRLKMEAGGIAIGIAAALVIYLIIRLFLRRK